MRKLDRIGIRENSRRLELLRTFRERYVEYYRNSEALYPLSPRHESAVAKQRRVEINRDVDEVLRILVAANIHPIYIHPDVSRLNLVINAFNLSALGISEDQLLDHLDRALGEYERGRRAAWVRSCNPLFWLGLTIEWVSRLPFVWLGRVGFDQAKLEGSALGRLVRFVLMLLGGVASFLTILKLLGFLNAVRTWLGVSPEAD